MTRPPGVPVHEAADHDRPVHQAVQAPVQHGIELHRRNQPDQYQEDEQRRHEDLVGQHRDRGAARARAQKITQPDAPGHGQPCPHDLPRKRRHHQQRPQMVQHQMLDAVDEKHALGVVVHPRMHRQVQQHQARPEEDAARTRHMVNPLAAHEQHDRHHEGSDQRGRELPGYEPFKTIHTGHPEDIGEDGTGAMRHPRRL
ncbi:hypothetical protein G6F31_017110 [Rhizopus arrhizus]|nr:hypothetical protein G6F31_017110 [Rhizopus arrhizus]